MAEFKKGDKFILELGDRRLDEFEIAGTDLYVKIYLLKKLTPYKPLDAAIDHCLEVAATCENKSCAADHIQLAGWLTELKERREQAR